MKRPDEKGSCTVDASVGFGNAGGRVVHLFP